MPPGTNDKLEAHTSLEISNLEITEEEEEVSIARSYSHGFDSSPPEPAVGNIARMERALSMDSSKGVELELQSKWRDWRVASLARGIHEEIWARNEDISRQRLLFDEATLGFALRLLEEECTEEDEDVDSTEAKQIHLCIPTPTQP